MSVKEHIGGMSNFIYFRAGNLWYKTDDTGFEFPIPVEDAAGATMDAQIKSITLMRWIRKHLAIVEQSHEIPSKTETSL